MADSLKYGRHHDSGYLIGRVFINKEYGFFVEGKHQLGYPFNTYGDRCIDKESLINIIESSIIYSLEFDLLTPPIEAIQEITVMQKIEQSGIFDEIFVQPASGDSGVAVGACYLAHKARNPELQPKKTHNFYLTFLKVSDR